jgi:hypothetical protein
VDKCAFRESWPLAPGQLYRHVTGQNCRHKGWCEVLLQSKPVLGTRFAAQRPNPVQKDLRGQGVGLVLASGGLDHIYGQLGAKIWRLHGVSKLTLKVYPQRVA